MNRKFWVEEVMAHESYDVVGLVDGEEVIFHKNFASERQAWAVANAMEKGDVMGEIRAAEGEPNLDDEEVI